MTTTIENKIAKSIEEQKLPALTGSVKQIAWATDIREKKLASLDNRLKRIQSNVSDDAQHRKNQIAYQAARNVLLTKVESRFWIDNRFVDGTSLIVANNLQDAYKAEVERLCNEAGFKAEVKAETDDERVNKPVETEPPADNNAAEEKLAVAVFPEAVFPEMEIPVKITANGNAIFLCGGFPVSEKTPRVPLYQAKIIGYNGKVDDYNYFASPIIAYQWLCRMVNANRNYADSPWIITRINDGVIKNIFEKNSKEQTVTDAQFRDFIDALEAKEHIATHTTDETDRNAVETDGSEDDPDDQKDVYKLLPALETLNDVDPPCAPKSPDITQASNEHKPKKSVSNPLEYWVSNYYGNFAKRKKLTHPRGKKFYFVDWDRTNYRNYWLTYTRDADEDKLLLGDQQHIWVKIPRSDALDLVKRGGQRTSVTPYWFVDCAAWFFDWSDMPIFPYVVKADSRTVNPKNIYVNRKSHTVEEC